MKMLRTRPLKTLLAALTGGLLLSLPAQAGNPPVPHSMASGNYVEDFADIANWTANFAAGIGAEPWGSVAINATGTIPDGNRTTVGTATFSSGTSGGVQKGTGNLVLLATGGTDNTSACAVDLYLDFTGKLAGTLSFDWAMVANATGDRAGSIRVYTSTDGTTWTELTGAAVLNVVNNVPSSGSVTSVDLPAAFGGSATARIRFYYYNGTGGITPTGSRPKISLDNLVVTTGNSAPTITRNPVGGTYWTPSTITLSATAVGSGLYYQWQKDSANLANGGAYSGVNTDTLTITSATAANQGAYRLVVTNSGGSATSDPATVTVSTPVPTITQQPIGGSYLLGMTLQLHVAATTEILNPPTLTYKWKRNGSDLTDGGQFSGVNTPTLSIANLGYANAADYAVTVSNPAGGVTSDPATVSVVTSGKFVQWNFNGATNVFGPAPSFGVGVASLVGTTNGFIPPLPANPGTPYDLGDPNNYWGTSTYPPQGTSNKQAGVQFTASTAGLKNIGVSLYTRLTGGSSKYSRLQYTTNGTDYLDFPASSTATAPANSWDFPARSWSLAGFPGVRNNPNFGVRVVTEFENTATYGTVNNSNYVGLTSTYSTSATVSYDLVTLTAEGITSANIPPTISPIADRTTTDTTPITVNFTVTGNGPFSVAASSSNQTALADWQITPIITGNNGSLLISPTPGFSGVAPVRVMATDALGDVTTTWFYLTTTAGNTPPSMTQIPHTNTLINTPLFVAFTVSDDGPLSSLQFTATSSNPTLLPNGNITLGGSGANRTLTLTPVAGATGVAPVLITVTDSGFNTATNAFTLMVRPKVTTLFNDFFDYPDGPLVPLSYRLWDTHSGTANQLDVTSGKLNITETESEDINALLIGQPYTNNVGTRLYSSFTVNFSSLPATGTTTNGSYFAHFKDNGTSNFRARVWAVTNGAAPGKFRLSIVNSSLAAGVAPTAIFPLDLELGKDYTVVSRIVVSNGVSTLWIDPTSETSVGVTDNSTVTSVFLSSYAIRQAAGEGTLRLDDLKIGLRFADVANVPEEIVITDISVTGGTVTINFDAGTTDTIGNFDLLGAGTANGTYSLVSGATITNPSAGKFRATAPTSGATYFYRVKRK